MQDIISLYYLFLFAATDRSARLQRLILIPSKIDQNINPADELEKYQSGISQHMVHNTFQILRHEVSRR